jgi:hypothetical protein
MVTCAVLGSDLCLLPRCGTHEVSRPPQGTAPLAATGEACFSDRLVNNPADVVDSRFV